MRIELTHVDYRYQAGSIQTAAALHDINLCLAAGDLTAVIGHGGSGKSTLALLLAGLYTPTAGSVCVYDAAGKKDPALFRKVGVVFQYPEQQLFGETVFEEVAFGCRNAGLPESKLAARVRAALTEVGLDADTYWYRSPFMLSGGQKRRVCLASVLAVEPQVLILDEPAAGLDESGRAWVAQLVRDLHAKGRTVVWVTHDMAEAAELAKQIVVLNQGQILLAGTPKQVFAEEAKLAQAHLMPPPAAQLVRKLKACGCALPGEAVTSAEALAEIRAWLKGGRAYV